MAILKQGSEGYYDSLEGKVPVKVKYITGMAGPPGQQTVVCVVSGAKHGYRKDRELAVPALWVVPSDAPKNLDYHVEPTPRADR